MGFALKVMAFYSICFFFRAFLIVATVYYHLTNRPMGCLMKMPDKPIDTNVIQSLMARVKTEEVRKRIQPADQLSDMILFHTRVLENGKKMEQAWDG